jgi:hypothetical protein
MLTATSALPTAVVALIFAACCCVFMKSWQMGESNLTLAAGVTIACVCFKPNGVFLLRRIVNNGESRVNDPRLIFPRDGLGRVALFIASAFWGPVFGFVAYAFLLVASPRSAEGWLVTTIVGKLGLAGMLFFIAGLVWSLFMPHWLESLVVRFTRRFILWLGLFVLLSLPYALWACIRA